MQKLFALPPGLWRVILFGALLYVVGGFACGGAMLTRVSG
jgi:hypothetical protein